MPPRLWVSRYAAAMPPDSGIVGLFVPGAVDEFECAGSGYAVANGVGCGGCAVVCVEVDGVDYVDTGYGSGVSVERGKCAGHYFFAEACLLECYDFVVAHVLVFGGVLCLGSGGTEVDVALVCGCTAVILVVTVR